MHLALAGQLHQAFGAGIALAEVFLAAVALTDADAFLGIGQNTLGAGPGFGLGAAQDRSQRQAEADVLLAPVAGGSLAHLGDALAYLLQRFAPHHVDVGVLGGHFNRGV